VNHEGELFPSLESRRFFTVAEAARLLGISIPGIHVWIRKGRIRRPTRVSKNGGYRIPRAEVVRLLKSARREVPGLWTPRRTKVLLIEDDAGIRELVATALRDPRFETHVETAATPEDGLLLIARYEPDVILLDNFHPMEGMTSEQALSILRRAKTLEGIKIIGLWPGEASRPRTPGPDAFLPKPFGAADLREAVLGLPPESLGPMAAARAEEGSSDRRRWEYKVSRPSRGPLHSIP
jgi:excisionase family DNA binding protein